MVHALKRFWRALSPVSRRPPEGGEPPATTKAPRERGFVVAARSGHIPSASRHLPDAAKGPEPSFALAFKGHIGASDAEAQRNPRARSAKLRAGIRTSAPPMPPIGHEIGLTVPQGTRH